MYIRRIEVENNGPIDYIDFHFPFAPDGNPRPVLFVGQNGSGKSILLSHIVNAMIVAKGHVYNDNDVEEGKVYKLRSPVYVKHGMNFYRAYVYLDDGFYQGEIQCRFNKEYMENEIGYTPADKKWNEIKTGESSVINSNFHERVSELKNKVSNSTMLYFPPNRFEEPAWLNSENLKNIASYNSAIKFAGHSRRKLVNYAPLRENQNWLLDVIYDSLAIERKATNTPTGWPNNPPVQILTQTNGPGTKLKNAIEAFLLKLLGGEPPVGWIVGQRGYRSISLTANGKVLTSNLFSLSTGQTALLDIFLTIMRDYDTSDAKFESLVEIRGTVVIDEIDMHLHTELQHTVLPELISLFPKVQFIVTTHSPLFILGLEKTLGNEGFELIDLPTGNPISVERFSEFGAAYRHFKESATFEQEMQKAIVESQAPALFVEGPIDIDYIKHAAILLNRNESLQRFRLLESGGFGGLDNLWKKLDPNMAQITNRRVTLLYDCDVARQKESKTGIARITIPHQDRLIRKGIENLFPDDLIRRAKAHNTALVDITPSIKREVRGVPQVEPERWEINTQEKRNLANWIIGNADAEDFRDFSLVFDLMDEAFAE